MSSTSEIKYNKEQTSHGIEQLKQSQKELYEADVLFYKGVMALAAAKGMDLIISEDSGINLYMPEKIIIECREEIANLIEDITAKINLIEGFNKEPKESIRSVERREIVEEKIKTEVQPMYGPSNTEIIDKPIQALYTPPGVTDSEPTAPIETPVTTPTVTPTEPQLDVVKEYESIPNTNSTITAGIIEKNYVSKHPKLIGGVAAAAGLFGIPTIISDDIDEEEEKRYNQKKTNLK